MSNYGGYPFFLLGMWVVIVAALALLIYFILRVAIRGAVRDAMGDHFIQIKVFEETGLWAGPREARKIVEDKSRREL